MNLSVHITQTVGNAFVRCSNGPRRESQLRPGHLLWASVHVFEGAVETGRCCSVHYLPWETRDPRGLPLHTCHTDCPESVELVWPVASTGCSALASLMSFPTLPPWHIRVTFLLFCSFDSPWPLWHGIRHRIHYSQGKLACWKAMLWRGQWAPERRCRTCRAYCCWWWGLWMIRKLTDAFSLSF